MRWNTYYANNIVWGKNISNLDEKLIIAKKVAEKVKDGDVLGIGSGSTSFLAIQEIGKRIKTENLCVIGIPTSRETELACQVLGIPTSSLLEHKPVWGFDGADEVDGSKNLIKGRGGALLREKLVMASSDKTYILVDGSKFVQKFGSRTPVPIEIHPEALHLVESKLTSLFNTEIEDIKMRMAVAKDGPIITENGNLLLDVKFNHISPGMESNLKSIPGVVETGLFMDYAIEIMDK
jgi:ribose 5-phosphate isomerase A